MSSQRSFFESNIAAITFLAAIAAVLALFVVGQSSKPKPELVEVEVAASCNNENEALASCELALQEQIAAQSSLKCPASASSQIERELNSCIIQNDNLNIELERAKAETLAANQRTMVDGIGSAEARELLEQSLSTESLKVKAISKEMEQLERRFRQVSQALSEEKQKVRALETELKDAPRVLTITNNLDVLVTYRISKDSYRLGGGGVGKHVLSYWDTLRFTKPVEHIQRLQRARDFRVTLSEAENARDDEIRVRVTTHCESSDCTK